MTYWVTYRMEARYVTAVEADSIEEAKTMAEEHHPDDEKWLLTTQNDRRKKNL